MNLVTKVSLSYSIETILLSMSLSQKYLGPLLSPFKIEEDKSKTTTRTPNCFTLTFLCRLCICQSAPHSRCQDHYATMACSTFFWSCISVFFSLWQRWSMALAAIKVFFHIFICLCPGRIAGSSPSTIQVAVFKWACNGYFSASIS